MLGSDCEEVSTPKCRKGLLTMDQSYSTSDIFVSISGMIGRSGQSECCLRILRQAPYCVQQLATSFASYLIPPSLPSLLLSFPSPPHPSFPLSLSLPILLQPGAGKTTLATKLAEKMNLPCFYEPVIDNVYLSDFYRDPSRYSFPLQVRQPHAVRSLGCFLLCSQLITFEHSIKV